MEDINCRVEVQLAALTTKTDRETHRHTDTQSHVCQGAFFSDMCRDVDKFENKLSATTNQALPCNPIHFCDHIH